MHSAVHNVLRRRGVDLVRYVPARFWHLRRMEIIADGNVAVVLDCGASDGRYGRSLRADGYGGRIISFEPLPDAFRSLAANAKADENWTCCSFALGAADEPAVLNIAGNLNSSSLLAMDDRHAAAAPESAYVGHESVRVVRLDSLMPSVIPAQERLFLKLDVQGSEMQVLAGAEVLLSQVEGLEVELSYTTLYEGQALMPEVAARLYDAGFNLVGLEPVLTDPKTRELLQADGLFVRRKSGDLKAL